MDDANEEMMKPKPSLQGRMKNNSDEHNMWNVDNISCDQIYDTVGTRDSSLQGIIQPQLKGAINFPLLI